MTQDDFDLAKKFRDFHTRGYCLCPPPQPWAMSPHSHECCPTPKGGKPWLAAVDLGRLAPYLLAEAEKHQGAFVINWDELRAAVSA